MLTTATLKGRFTSALIDTLDSDTIPLQGTVTLTPSVRSILTEENGEPTTVLPTAQTIELNTDGRLPETEIVATNIVGASPQNWTWLVSFNLKTPEGRPVRYAPYNFLAPTGEVVDLTLVTPVEEYSGTVVTRGTDGIGIEGFSVTGTTMTMALSDGTTQAVELPVLNPDNVTVVDGEDGRGIQSIVDNGDSTITVVYDDATTSAPITIPTMQGLPGVDGNDGLPGADGNDGKSAYELAVQEGFTGSLSDWLASLEGPAGEPGVAGQPGADGLSAYEVAVANGFVGTEAEWLESLKGEPGEAGTGGGGTGNVIVQESEPVDAPVGTVWVW